MQESRDLTLGAVQLDRRRAQHRQDRRGGDGGTCLGGVSVNWRSGCKLQPKQHGIVLQSFYICF